LKNYVLTFFMILSFMLFGCRENETNKELYNSDNLIINQISKSVYQHISFIEYGNLRKQNYN